MRRTSRNTTTVDHHDEVQDLVGLWKGAQVHP
jgi:hypothetical protein